MRTFCQVLTSWKLCFRVQVWFGGKVQIRFSVSNKSLVMTSTTMCFQMCKNHELKEQVTKLVSCDARLTVMLEISSYLKDTWWNLDWQNFPPAIKGNKKNTHRMRQYSSNWKRLGLYSSSSWTLVLSPPHFLSFLFCYWTSFYHPSVIIFLSMSFFFFLSDIYLCQSLVTIWCDSLFCLKRWCFHPWK